MHLNNLVAVVFRLGLLTAMLGTVTQIISFSSSYYVLGDSSNPNSISICIQLLVFIGFLVVFWIVTKSLSNLVCEGFNEPLSLKGLSQEQIIIVVCIFVGITTCVTEVGSLISVALHFWKAGAFCKQDNPFLISQAASSFAQLVLGLWLILGCRKIYNFLKRFIEPTKEVSPQRDS